MLRNVFFYACPVAGDVNQRHDHATVNCTFEIAVFLSQLELYDSASLWRFQALETKQGFKMRSGSFTPADFILLFNFFHAISHECHH